MSKLLARLYVVFGSLMSTTCSNAQIVPNEFSQGENGSKEYIELVVTGKRTCRDSVADIRRWIIDDQNGWYGGLERGISTGHFRFRDTAIWAAVPFGAIILIYNGEDKNGSILQDDDPTDANQDNIFILPHHSPYLEVHRSEPASPSSTEFRYPLNGFSTPVPADWTLRAGLNNAGDAIIIVAPSLLDKASFSLYYSGTPLPPFQLPSVAFPETVEAGENCALQDSLFSRVESWKKGAVPEQETPGRPNTPQNVAWILALQKRPEPIPASHIYACLKEGEIYSMNGSSLEASGTYSFVFTTATGCDSLVYLHLTIPITVTQTRAGCEKVEWAGITYTTSGKHRDTIRNGTNTCDSIYRVTYIKVLTPPHLRVMPDTAVCKGAPIMLTAETAAPWVQWIGYPPGHSVRVRPEKTTNYQAVAKDNAGCMNTAFVKVTVSHFELKITTSTNAPFPGNVVTLQTGANLPYEVISWSPPALFPAQQARQQVISISRSEDIVVSGKSVNGCQDTGRTTISVLPEVIFIPTAFTPNGDGKNDQLKIVMPQTEAFHLSIFNRWGEMIFRSDHPDQGWDGKRGGLPQPAGTYVYYLTALLPDGTKVQRKGTVRLLY